jgi:hypothetical protein
VFLTALSLYSCKLRCGGNVSYCVEFPAELFPIPAPASPASIDQTMAILSFEQVLAMDKPEVTTGGGKATLV